MTRKPGDLPDAVVLHAGGVYRVNGGKGPSRDDALCNVTRRETIVTKFRSTAFICAVLFPAAAWAQDNDAIVVTANRTPTPVSKVGLSVSVIDAADIERLQTPAIAELLRTVPGIAITRNGGVGTFSSTFIRGASADHTVALIDGVKINDPSSTAGGFDFGRLMAGNLERIEVVRGPQSVLWGSQAIGGVVNMITRKPTEQPSGSLNGEYGYRDTVDLVGNAGASFGPLALSGGALYYRTDGISAASEERGGSERDGVEQYGANLNATATVTDTLSLDLRGWYSRSETDLDGFPAPAFVFADTDEWSRTREAIGYAGLNWTGLDGRWRNRIAWSIMTVHRDNYNPDAAAEHQYDAFGRNHRAEFQSIFDIAEGWNLVAGAEREWARFSIASDFGFGASTNEGRSRLTSFYGQLMATPLAGLTATVGLRHDDHDRFGGHTTFAANAAYTPNDGATVVRASYGEGFKAPSLYQLFSEYGNTALDPETAKSWDVGIVQNALDGAAQIGVTWFRRKSRNLIDFVTCTDAGDPSPLCDFAFDGYYDNVSRALARGIEAEIRLRPVEALSVAFNYSYVKSQDEATDRDLARRPRQKVYASIDYRWPFGLSTGASVTHVGASYNSNFDTIRNADYVLTDIRASYPLSGKVELYGRVENLFDADYETVYGYGSPGRAAYAGIRLKL